MLAQEYLIYAFGMPANQICYYDCSDNNNVRVKIDAKNADDKFIVDFDNNKEIKNITSFNTGEGLPWMRPAGSNTLKITHYTFELSQEIFNYLRLQTLSNYQICD